jgi:hypothetical protein
MTMVRSSPVPLKTMFFSGISLVERDERISVAGSRHKTELHHFTHGVVAREQATEGVSSGLRGRDGDRLTFIVHTVVVEIDVDRPTAKRLIPFVLLSIAVVIVVLDPLDGCRKLQAFYGSRDGIRGHQRPNFQRFDLAAQAMRVLDFLILRDAVLKSSLTGATGSSDSTQPTDKQHDQDSKRRRTRQERRSNNRSAKQLRPTGSTRRKGFSKSGMDGDRQRASSPLRLGVTALPSTQQLFPDP